MSELSDIEPLRQPALDLPISLPAQESPAPNASPSLDPAASAAAPMALGTGDAVTAPTSPLPEPVAVGSSAVSIVRPVTLLVRVRRLLAGVVLLALTWGFLLVALVLANAAWTFMRGSHALLLRAGAGVGATVVVLWLGVAMIACLLAGAYCLMLAVSRRS